MATEILRYFANKLYLAVLLIFYLSLFVLDLFIFFTLLTAAQYKGFGSWYCSFLKIFWETKVPLRKLESFWCSSPQTSMTQRRKSKIPKLNQKLNLMNISLVSRIFLYVRYFRLIYLKCIKLFSLFIWNVLGKQFIYLSIFGW